MTLGEKFGNDDAAIDRYLRSGEEPRAPQLVQDEVRVCENCGASDGSLHIVQGGTMEEYVEECTNCLHSAYNRSVFIPREEQR